MEIEKEKNEFLKENNEFETLLENYLFLLDNFEENVKNDNINFEVFLEFVNKFENIFAKINETAKNNENLNKSENWKRNQIEGLEKVIKEKEKTFEKIINSFADK